MAGQRDARSILIKAAFAALVGVAAFEELSYMRSRASRAYHGWWADSTHRQNHKLDAAAVELLVRLANR